MTVSVWLIILWAHQQQPIKKKKKKGSWLAAEQMPLHWQTNPLFIHLSDRILQIQSGQSVTRKVLPIYALLPWQHRKHKQMPWVICQWWEAALYSDFDMSLDRETERTLTLAQMSFNTSRQIHSFAWQRCDLRTIEGDFVELESI